MLRRLFKATTEEELERLKALEVLAVGQVIDAGRGIRGVLGDRAAAGACLAQRGERAKNAGKEGASRGAYDMAGRGCRQGCQTRRHGHQACLQGRRKL